MDQESQVVAHMVKLAEHRELMLRRDYHGEFIRRPVSASRPRPTAQIVKARIDDASTTAALTRGARPAGGEGADMLKNPTCSGCE